MFFKGVGGEFPFPSPFPAPFVFALVLVLVPVILVPVTPVPVDVPVGELVELPVVGGFWVAAVVVVDPGSELVGTGPVGVGPGGALKPTLMPRVVEVYWPFIG